MSTTMSNTNRNVLGRPLLRPQHRVTVRILAPVLSRPSVRVRVAIPPSEAGKDDAQLVIFPENGKWAWQKAEPKLALKEYQQAGTASNAILNVIELLHWASFPLGFWIAHYTFMHSATLAHGFGGDSTRVFLFMLGGLSQVFGGGNAVLMHVYEGWMVAPFRNPLLLPDKVTVQEVEVPNYNNAWLRAATYQMLFSFNTLGLSLMSVAGFGINPCTTALLAASVLVPLLGPHTPRTDFRVNGQPVLPLSQSLFWVFIINALINVVAYKVIFGDALAAAPWLAGVPKPVSEWLPILTPLVTGAGGLIEGAIAESTFNQWWHFIAFVILLLGLGSNAVLLQALVQAAPLPVCHGLQKTHNPILWWNALLRAKPLDKLKRRGWCLPVPR